MRAAPTPTLTLSLAWAARLHLLWGVEQSSEELDLNPGPASYLLCSPGLRGSQLYLLPPQNGGGDEDEVCYPRSSADRATQ